ncbi:hypothetical protein ACWFR1_27425 [Streptomyces sp. NPDC055103]
MTYLRTDVHLNAREAPTRLEAEFIDRIDEFLLQRDPVAINKQESMWYLGTALPGESNLEVVLPLAWDPEFSLRLRLRQQEGFSIGWGGDLGEPPFCQSFAAGNAEVDDMVSGFACELYRDIRLSHRRLLFGGVSEFHIRTPQGWVDLSRGGIPSTDSRMRKAKRAVTLLG